MANNNQKLELAWIGKDKQPKLEPRILIEDPEKSYHASERKSDADIFDNVLIHGDNLLALKALEQDYASLVQCIYIDPPFNTGEAFDNYDDGLEHSVWLSLMRDRISILHSLLHESGTIFIHIDDNELGYLIAICDEILGRQNRISIVSFKQSSVSGPKSRNPGVVSIGNFIIIYARNKDKWKNRNTYKAIRRDPRYNQFIENFDEGHDAWRFVPLSEAIGGVFELPFKEWEQKHGRQVEKKVEEFVIANRHRIVQLVSVAEKDVNANAREALIASKQENDRIFVSQREDADDYYFVNGKQIAFYRSKVREIDGNITTAERVSNIWDDLLSNNVHKEGGVRFPKGKKPEALIKRCFEIATDPGDLVLDSFLGSGTTAAVAQKMHRRWIGIELGDHAVTHCLPRLCGVVDGVDTDGVTKAVSWSGGGGFRYYRLAPSLLERDKYGNWVISKDYQSEMLVEAMCKHMGFTYAPSQIPDEYWNHGYSTETDFIFITTQNLTHQALAKIAEDVGPDRSLLICCKAFNANSNAFENLTIKKIPHAILRKCEWDQDDYSLNVENLPIAAGKEADVHPSVPPDDLPLFATEEGGTED